MDCRLHNSSLFPGAHTVSFILDACSNYARSVQFVFRHWLWILSKRLKRTTALFIVAYFVMMCGGVHCVVKNVANLTHRLCMQRIHWLNRICMEIIQVPLPSNKFWNTWKRWCSHCLLKNGNRHLRLNYFCYYCLLQSFHTIKPHTLFLSPTHANTLSFSRKNHLHSHI